MSGLNDKIVIGSQEQESDLQTALGDRYQRIGAYVLRPGFNLLLYSLRDIDESHQDTRAQVDSPK
jgi:hypothetical protein